MPGMKGEGKKPGGLLAIFAGKKGGESDEETGDMDDMGEVPDMESAKMNAAADALAAFKSGDESALSDALTRHYEACASGGGEEY